MPPGSRSAASRKPRRWRIVSFVLLLALSSTVALVAFQEAESFLISDPRFELMRPPDYSFEGPSIRIGGIRNASRKAVLQTFARDFGRSLYLMPIAERRRNLLAVDWVRDATVTRVWPNRVDVFIDERMPVAFAALPGATGAARWTLIDDDGVLIEPHGPVRVRLPVLVGVRRDQDESTRRDRVRRMRRVLEEAGKMSPLIQDVDVTNPENLSVTLKKDGRALVLMLGDSDFRERFENFEQHYPEIHRHAPDANVFDLRSEKRITLPAGSEPESRQGKE